MLEKSACLQKQLGAGKDLFPTEMTIGDRAYEILNFLKESKDLVIRCTMVDIAKELNAHLGQDDGKYILKHQDEIPVSLRGKVVFIFTNWRHSFYSDGIYYVCWEGDCWARIWFSENDYQDDHDRLLRRK